MCRILNRERPNWKRKQPPRRRRRRPGSELIGSGSVGIPTGDWLIFSEAAEKKSVCPLLPTWGFQLSQRVAAEQGQQFSGAVFADVAELFDC